MMAMTQHTITAAPVAQTVSMFRVKGPTFFVTWSPTVMLVDARTKVCGLPPNMLMPPLHLRRAA